MSESFKPHAYTKVAIKFCVAQACAGLLLSPGLGKTAIIYAVFKILKKMGFVSRMLVIAPLRPAQITWPAEQEKWSDFADLKVAVLHGPCKDLLLDSDADVHVINPEGLLWLRDAMAKRDWWWDMLAVDESTRFKHTNTQRFKILKPMLPKFGRRYILTGSPAPNGLLDLFGQIFILDLGHALGPFITKYRLEYFDSTGYGGYTYVPKEDSAERIYKAIKPLVLRMDARDLLELPPLVFNTVYVDLPAEARKQYDQMEDLMITQLDTQVITAANMAVATGKCRQIANGGLYTIKSDENGKEIERVSHHIHEAKIEAVMGLVEELQGSPALIAYEFKHDLERLQKAFPEAPYIGGGVTRKRFAEIERAWNRGEISVLLAQPQSVAHGLNLQGTVATVISHSLTWNLEDDEQFIQRIYRQGQKHRVMVHRVVARKTVDEVILRMLARKDRTQQALLSALNDYGRRRR